MTKGNQLAGSVLASIIAAVLGEMRYEQTGVEAGVALGLMFWWLMLGLIWVLRDD